MFKKEIFCPVCNSQNVQFQSVYRNTHNCFSKLNRFSCLECELNFANPMPKISSLNNYNASYHDSAHGGADRNIKVYLPLSFSIRLVSTSPNPSQKNLNDSSTFLILIIVCKYFIILIYN